MKKNTNINYPKLQNGDQNYPKLCISLNTEPHGGIYRHQGKGRLGDKPWPKVRARPRPYGHENAAKVAFPRLF